MAETIYIEEYSASSPISTQSPWERDPSAWRDVREVVLSGDHMPLWLSDTNPVKHTNAVTLRVTQFPKKHENDDLFTLDDIPNFVTDVIVERHKIEISESAAEGRLGLKTFSSDGHVVINERAFKGSSIELFAAQNVESCNAYAFQNCAKLHTVISNKLTLAGSGIFENCSELKNVPDMECRSGQGVNFMAIFYGCLKLTHDPCHGRWGMAMHDFMFTNSGIRAFTSKDRLFIQPWSVFGNCDNLQTVNLFTCETCYGSLNEMGPNDNFRLLVLPKEQLLRTKHVEALSPEGRYVYKVMPTPNGLIDEENKLHWPSNPNLFTVAFVSTLLALNTEFLAKSGHRGPTYEVFVDRVWIPALEQLGATKANAHEIANSVRGRIESTKFFQSLAVSRFSRGLDADAKRFMNSGSKDLAKAFYGSTRSKLPKELQDMVLQLALDGRAVKATYTDHTMI